MANKKSLLIIGSIFSFLFIINFVIAVPSITIHSPQNITYDVNKILINVTSDEPVTFYIVDSRGRSNIIAENITFYESYLYVKTGTYDFTIWANNSNNEKINESVTFATTEHNPINITNCGYLYSPDTSYLLVQDISPISQTSRYCLQIYELRNITLNLNGKTVTSFNYPTLDIRFNSNVNVFNGTLNGTPFYHHTDNFRNVIRVEGTKYSFKDLKINGHIGMLIWELKDSVFENIFINSTSGIVYGPTVHNVHIINSTFIWNGFTGPYYKSSAFMDQSISSEFFLQEVNISGFPEYDFYFENTYSDFYLRNTNANMSRIRYTEEWLADARFFRQHLVVVNVTDQFNETGSGVIEIRGKGSRGAQVITKTVANPTSDFMRFHHPTDCLFRYDQIEFH